MADDIFVRAADGTGEEQVLLATPANEWGFDWTPDGKYLVGSGQGEVWYLRLSDDGAAQEMPAQRFFVFRDRILVCPRRPQRIAVVQVLLSVGNISRIITIGDGLHQG